MVDLKEDFERLYNESILSDVKLRTTTQTFHTHKVILSARSSVLRAMFSTDMKEKIQEYVDVPDLENDTVRRMLQYVYTNSLEGLQWESALKLYVAAAKYEIVTLKNRCSSFLKCNLCPNNLCDVLVLADKHGDGDLKKSAQICALEHKHDVFNSDE
ncbi:tdpoz3 [Trichonephila clavata]|uniref:Tdpoz3 n=1 Tax=Trichonephila clavata TaxID=2740835 RepID=A0A8X6L7I9_TRICU|nr:tdpoz3 [Trichonephila clavata]